MSLYLPRAFDERDLSRLDVLAAAHPFVTLITVDAAGPIVSHVPVRYARDGQRIALHGHLAKPNPQARHAAEALAIVHGPQAYVSPTWYPDKAQQARVPTWNYVVAHLSGALTWFDDEAGLGAVVASLGNIHEAAVGGDWRFDMDDPAERSQLRGIVGFRLDVAQVEFKAKLSQNHPLENRRAVAGRLDASSRPGDRDVARWMRAALPDSIEGD